MCNKYISTCLLQKAVEICRRNFGSWYEIRRRSSLLEYSLDQIYFQLNSIINFGNTCPGLLFPNCRPGQMLLHQRKLHWIAGPEFHWRSQEVLQRKVCPGVPQTNSVSTVGILHLNKLVDNTWRNLHLIASLSEVFNLKWFPHLHNFQAESIVALAWPILWLHCCCCLNMEPFHKCKFPNKSPQRTWEVWI